MDAADQPTRFASRDQAAFAALYESTAAQVFGLVYTMVNDRCAAEDVTSQAYCQVWRAADEDTAGLEDMRVRLLATAHQYAAEYLRAHRDTEVSQSPLPVALPAHVPLTDPLSRQLLELVYFRGHTCTQAATFLGLTPQAAHATLRKAILTLPQMPTTPPIVESEAERGAVGEVTL